MFSTRTSAPKADGRTTTIRQQQPRTRPILYPEFKEASEYEEDSYWKQALVNASHGEFSSKLTLYTSGRLTRKDLTTPGTRVPKNNPEAAAKAFIKFHKKHERTLSDQELERQVSRRYEVCSRPVHLSWSSASIQMKRAALNYYSMMTCDNMTFSSEIEKGRSFRDLSATLFIAMQMKLLDERTVNMSNNIITSVDCVKYDKKYNSWVLVATTRRTK